MGVLQRVVKPRTQKAKRALEYREPKKIENTKQSLFLYGQNTSEITRKCMKDLYALKREFALHMSRKKAIVPFEDAVPLERLSQKHDSSLFAFVNHSKKRPHNLTIGRTFDNQILDMVELGIESYTSLSDIVGPKVSVSTKPCLIFCGPEFEDDNKYGRLKNLLVDFFKGVEAKAVRLQGFEHALLFTLCEGKLYFRSYRILLKKSGLRKPRVELEEIGPSSTMVLRRSKLASADLFKRSCKQPKKPKTSRKKNITRDPFGTKLGRVHMTKQDLGGLQTRKMKALKKNKKKGASNNTNNSQ